MWAPYGGTCFPVNASLWEAEVLVQNQLGIFKSRVKTEVLEYMFNIVEINCSFLVQGFLKRFQKLTLITLHVHFHFQFNF